MRQPHLVIIDPNLTSLRGHNLDYAARLAGSAEVCGIHSVIVAHKAFQASDTHRLDILPLFETGYWQELAPDNGEDPFVNLSRTAAGFSEVMRHVFRQRALEETDVLFLPCANLTEVRGIVRLAAVLERELPRTAFLFRRELDEQGHIAQVGPRMGTGLLRQALADLSTCPGAHRVRLFTDSDGLSEEYQTAVRRPFTTVPIPVDPAFSRPRVTPGGIRPITLLYLGDARTEKGYQQLPQLCDDLAEPLSGGKIRLVCQSNFNTPEGETGIAESRQRLRQFPNVVLLDEALDSETYVTRMHQADLVLLPYQTHHYVARTSGILAEAIVSAVPVVVPQGTWLSDQIRHHGAGLTYDETVTGALSHAVRQALAGLAALNRRAFERRSAFAQFHNPDRLLRFVCGDAVLERAQIPSTGLAVSVHKGGT